MAEHPNAEKIRTAYAAFTAGDLPAVVEAFAPDAVFHVAGDGPTTGDHKGHQAITALLVDGFHKTGGTQRIEVRSIYADDHHGVVVAHETATRAHDGATLDIEEVHLLALAPDGRVTDFWDVPSDPDVHDAFFDG
ncbi:MAG: nuclear transport factor 2 family protein [Acidimicrobiia bacterium]